MGKKKIKAVDYLDNLSADSMTGNWEPIGAWRDVHGDCKSSTRGRWTMRTMATSQQTFKVQVLDNGTAIRNLEYSSEPSFDDIVSDLKAGNG
ncbi:hypothetical protein QQZ08_009401 [Neonectria magnoliae]|uniref:Uncharacterized protein n=1 Tax=Neonectria magnoliae TaxID=2732573 RepID=A0ABR1HQG4_9HYPO